MGNRISHHRARLTLCLSVCLTFSAFAQQKEKPQLKNFGESLKRIKWDPERKAAVETKPSSDSQASPETDVVRVETSLVTDDVLILDAHGNPVKGLTNRDFVITEEGRSQRVGMFSLGDDVNVPRTIVLIFDYHCAQLPFLKASIAAAKTLVDKLEPNDRMAIVTDDIELLQSYTSNKQTLKDSLDNLVKRTNFDPQAFYNGTQRPPLGRGFVYSALMAVLREAFDDEDQRPIIIFQTDGDEAYLLRDPIVVPTMPPGVSGTMRKTVESNLKHFRQFQKKNQRDFSLNDVYKTAEQTRATIYTVVPGFRLLGLSDEESLAGVKEYFATTDYLGLPGGRPARDRWTRVPEATLRFAAQERIKTQSALAVLSTVTGGWIEFLNRPSQADEIYSRILTDINKRYIVGYYPTNKEHDGKRRKISITVRDHPEYIVMGRKAYYAPDPNQ